MASTASLETYTCTHTHRGTCLHRRVPICLCVYTHRYSETRTHRDMHILKYSHMHEQMSPQACPKGQALTLWVCSHSQACVRS